MDDVQALTSEMLLEAADAVNLDELQRRSVDFLCRTTDVIPDSPEAFLIKPSDIIDELSSNPEPLIPIAITVSKAEIDDYLSNLSPMEREQMMRECDELLLPASRPPSLTSSAAHSKVSREAADEDCGFDFVGRPAVEFFGYNGTEPPSATQMRDRLFDDASSSQLPSEGANGGVAPLVADTQVGYQVYMRCAAAEKIREQKLIRMATHKISERMQQALENQNRGKRAAVQALFDMLRVEVNRSRDIVSLFPKLSERAVAASLDQRDRMIWSRDRLACEACEKVFTKIVRRHHCRRCGRCLCNACSCNLGMFPIRRRELDAQPASGEGRVERVCARCYKTCATFQEQQFESESDAKFYDATKDNVPLDDSYDRYFVFSRNELSASLLASYTQITAHAAVETTSSIVSQTIGLCLGTMQAAYDSLFAQIQAPPTRQRELRVEDRH